MPQNQDDTSLDGSATMPPDDVSRYVNHTLQRLPPSLSDLAAPLRLVSTLCYPYWIDVARIRANRVIHHLWVHDVCLSMAITKKLERSAALRLLTIGLVHDTGAFEKKTSETVQTAAEEAGRRAGRWRHMMASGIAALDILQRVNAISHPAVFELADIEEIVWAVLRHDFTSLRRPVLRADELIWLFSQIDILFFCSEHGPATDLWRRDPNAPVTDADLRRQFRNELVNTRQRLQYVEGFDPNCRSAEVFPDLAARDVYRNHIDYWARRWGVTPDQLFAEADGQRG
jgi:hypothetical protein